LGIVTAKVGNTYNYFINMKRKQRNLLDVEIPAFEFKLTANKNYRSTGVGTVGDRLGAGVKSQQGMNGHVFF
jgi:hypothetical protein